MTTRRPADRTEWAEIVRLYDVAPAAAPTPIVELNRAAAVAMAVGPAPGPRPGWRSWIGSSTEGALADYPYLHAARADLLRRLDRRDEAAATSSTALTAAAERHS